MDIKIRPAEAGDADDIIRLLLNIAALHHDGRPDIFRNAVSKYDGKQFAEKLKQKDSPIFVAVDGDGKIEGYIFCVIKETSGHILLADRKYLYVDDLCVDESARGEGIGGMLMAEAEKYAREADCSAIELNVWNIKNGAKAFYEKLGMKEQRCEMEKKLK